MRSNVLFIMKIDKKNFKNSQRCSKGVSMEFIMIFLNPFLQFNLQIVDFMFSYLSFLVSPN